MATRITDDAMSSNVTRHTAHRTQDGWSVSWLPGRPLTRNQAVTAMTLAEVVVTHADDLADNSSRWWLHIASWAAELSLTVPHAVAEASLSPEGHADMPAVITLAFDSQPGRRGYLLSTDPATGMARVRIDGETVTMPAGYFQYAGSEPAQDDEGDAAAPGCSALIVAMTAYEVRGLLAYISGYAPEVLDAAIANWSPTYAAELAERADAGLSEGYPDKPQVAAIVNGYSR